MRDFTKRRGSDTRRLALTLCGGALLLLLSFGMVRAAWGMYGKFAEAARGDDIAQAKLSDLEEQQAQVSMSVESLSSPRGVEQEVRELYGVGKPGEGQIQIIRNAPSTTTPPAQGPGVFMRVWRALFGWI